MCVGVEFWMSWKGLCRRGRGRGVIVSLVEYYLFSVALYGQSVVSTSIIYSYVFGKNLVHMSHVTKMLGSSRVLLPKYYYDRYISKEHYNYYHILWGRRKNYVKHDNIKYSKVKTRHKNSSTYLKWYSYFMLLARVPCIEPANERARKYFLHGRKKGIFKQAPTILSYCERPRWFNSMNNEQPYPLHNLSSPAQSNLVNGIDRFYFFSHTDESWIDFFYSIELSNLHGFRNSIQY